VHIKFTGSATDRITQPGLPRGWTLPICAN